MQSESRPWWHLFRPYVLRASFPFVERRFAAQLPVRPAPASPTGGAALAWQVGAPQTLSVALSVHLLLASAAPAWLVGATPALRLLLLLLLSASARVS